MKGHAESRKRLEVEIAMLRQRLESAEEMRVAITRGELDGFVVGLNDEERRIMLLDAARRNYDQMVNCLQQATTTVSSSGEILYANHQFAAMLGEPLADLFSGSLHRYVGKNHRNNLNDFLTAGATDSTLEVTLRRRDGTQLPVRLNITSFGDGHASLLVTDLTSRERLEEAEGALDAIRTGRIDGVVVGGEEIILLGTAHRPYEAIVERMQQGAVTVSPEAEVLYANDRFVAMVGVPRERVLGERLGSFFSPGDGDALQRIVEQSRAGGGQGEAHIARGDGSMLPVLLTGAPVDNLGSLTLMLTDLSEQRRHREIEDSNRRKDEFLAVLAHELRNPLAPIRNAAQVLQWMPELDLTARQAADIIARQSATLARLIDDLLDINRLNQGKITLQSRPVDLKEVIANAVEAAQPFLQEHRHTLELELPPEAVYVRGDAVRLTQVVLNLLSNAAKYTPRGGRVGVALRQEGRADGDRRAVMRVTDSGIGIPAHLLGKIFERYAQVGNVSDERASGLGLGLTVARGLVQLHNGSITAHSRGSGQGSEFVVDLPACASPVTPQLATDATLTPSARSGMRILVADDNADSVRSLAMMLDLSGHQTRIAKDGIEALLVADEFRPHIAFLDIGMPNLDGYATARELRSRPWGKDVALFALTGWGQPEDRRRAEDAGFDEHVVKPLDPADLERLIASTRRESRG